ncbi:uncharacterized protein BDZ99DRAFT_493872 [Mytilinidion resinicola]|uniref:Uncharacterized protein n=1 Tax=Mytilinidion resinicola TaxID=574789 RepID=A0A6A6Z6P2_9PEZI|nr:uncharacterized protein BDZ99DRAFT_493872 [Mytilinidion resinicola]KAF2815937.1 hypothetical protein BDZ99DRAFT_493872 [Mytilinidion resinicola]
MFIQSLLGLNRATTSGNALIIHQSRALETSSHMAATFSFPTQRDRRVIIPESSASYSQRHLVRSCFLGFCSSTTIKIGRTSPGVLRVGNTTLGVLAAQAAAYLWAFSPFRSRRFWVGLLDPKSSPAAGAGTHICSRRTFKSPPPSYDQRIGRSSEQLKCWAINPSHELALRRLCECVASAGDYTPSMSPVVYIDTPPRTQRHRSIIKSASISQLG